MNGGSGGAPQIFADQERAAAAPARRLITRPPDFEIFRHPLIVHTFFTLHLLIWRRTWR